MPAAVFNEPFCQRDSNPATLGIDQSPASGNFGIARVAKRFGGYLD
jgi:hypothetical protein